MNELLVRAKAGDRTAEKRIFERLSVTFVEIAKRRVGDLEAAKDIAQEACITVLEKYRTEEFSVSFEAWAYGVLRMKIGNHLQRYPVKHKKLRRSLGAADMYDSTVDFPDHELRLKLIDCIRRISKSYRTYARVLNLSYQGFSSEEICRRLKINTGNMRVILSRGRSVLRNCLERGVV